jgi:hypothetical protein
VPCTATGRGKNGVLMNIPSSWIVQSALRREGVWFRCSARGWGRRVAVLYGARSTSAVTAMGWHTSAKGRLRTNAPCVRRKKSQYVWAAMVASWIRFTGPKACTGRRSGGWRHVFFKRRIARSLWRSPPYAYALPISGMRATGQMQQTADLHRSMFCCLPFRPTKLVCRR